MAYKLIEERKFNQDYRGHAEGCTWTFTVALPDQLGSYWTAEQLLQAHIAELEAQGSIILEYRLWEDKAPTFTTDYMVDIVASASPLLWNVIIIGVLALLIIIAIAYSIKQVRDIAQYSPVGLPLLALAGIAAATAVVIYLVRRR